MENYPVPLILKCIVTGLEVKYYSRPYIEKRIATWESKVDTAEAAVRNKDDNKTVALGT